MATRMTCDRNKGWLRLLSLTGAASLLALLTVALAGCGGGSGSGGSDTSAAALTAAADNGDDLTREVVTESSVLLGADVAADVSSGQPPARPMNAAAGPLRRQRRGLHGVVTELNPGVSFRLTHLPPAPGTEGREPPAPLTVTLSAETIITEPDDAAATLTNGASVLVQGRLDRENRAIAAIRIVVVPVVGRVANLRAQAQTFELQARFLRPHRGSGGGPGNGRGEGGTADAQPSQRSEPQPIHVVTTAATIYQNRDPQTGTATPAAFADVTEGRPAAVFGILDTATRTLAATRVDILPAPPTRPQQ